MHLATAYPNSALSAGQLTIIAVVMAGTLLIWLGLVFLADRRGTKKVAARPSDSHLAMVAQPDWAADNKHSEAGHAPADGRHGAAA